MQQRDEIPQEIWEQAHEAASNMSPEERTEAVLRKMTQDFLNLYYPRIQKGISSAEQNLLRQEFIASYPTENLQKLAAIAHDRFKQTMVKESLKFSFRKPKIIFLLGIVVILLLVICYEVVTLI